MDKKPFVSIIIPTYNRPKQLLSCLESLTHLDYPVDGFEVIIVDDGSSIELNSVVVPFKEKLTVELVRQDNAGPAAARNTGSTHAKGQLLAFTDDDCQPAPNWLQALAQKFTEFPDALLGGYTLNQLSDNIYSEASQLLLDYLYSYYNSDPNKAHFFASNNLALAKEHFYSLVRFDTTFPLAAAEDREFCDRCLNQGYRLVYASAAQVYHAHHLNLRSFWRQHFNYGRGAFHFHQVRSQRNVEKIQIEPLSFYFQLLTYPLRHRSFALGVTLSTLFFVSQLANVAGFFWQLVRHNRFTSLTVAS